MVFRCGLWSVDCGRQAVSTNKIENNAHRFVDTINRDKSHASPRMVIGAQEANQIEAFSRVVSTRLLLNMSIISIVGNPKKRRLIIKLPLEATIFPNMIDRLD